MNAKVILSLGALYLSGLAGPILAQPLNVELAVSGTNDSLSLAQQDKLGVLHMIEQSFRTSYAPAGWKTQFAGWQLASQVSKIRQKVISNPQLSTRDFQRLLLEFVESTKDYHVGIEFVSTESARLPLQIRSAWDADQNKRRYFVAEIDRSKLGPQVFPFLVGDEIISFGQKTIDGKIVPTPIEEAVQEVRKSLFRDNVSLTDQFLSEINLTSRSRRRGAIVPTGSILLQLKRNPKNASYVTRVDLASMTPDDPRFPLKDRLVVVENFDATLSVQLAWEYTPEAIKYDREGNSSSPRMASSVLAGISGAGIELEEQPLGINTSMVAPSILSPETTNTSWGMGSPRGFLPNFGQVEWRFSGLFNPQLNRPMPPYLVAYTYSLNGKRVGYVRIPSYGGPLDQAAAEFTEIVRHFSEFADVMVIDQLNNPGGNVLYLYGLLSRLTDRALAVPRHRITLTQAEIMRAQNLLTSLEDVNSEADALAAFGPSIFGYPVSLTFAQQMKNYARFLVDEWNQGKVLTDPVHIAGVDYVNPHPEANFTKPIVVLTNPLDFSGGDFFPASLQDNNRALIVGQRTAGAGGYVLQASMAQLNRSGVAAIWYTGSLAERTEGSVAVDKPIENLGVTPDVDLELNPQDFQQNYMHYIGAVNKILLDVIKAGSVPAYKDSLSAKP